jgi:hypothetical protein
MARKLALVLLLLGLLLLKFLPAEADHNIYLPYAGNTWIMKLVEKDHQYTYCLDARADSYPSFRAQLENVVKVYQEETGIRGIRVAFSDPSCQVKHLMLPPFPCSAGAAACIYYANQPVEIHYQENLGYSDWRSGQGHELGHGLLGLHERYRDSGGSIGCVGPEAGFTVMDCGPPYIKYPTELDINRASFLFTSWFAKQEPEPCTPLTTVTQPTWDSCAQQWKFPNLTAYEPATGNWYHHGLKDWGRCATWGGRYNFRAEGWMVAGTAIFKDGFWSTAPRC